MTAMGVGSSAAYGAVDVDAAAEEIVAARTVRKSVIVQNADASVDLYIGDDANVTTANGIKVPAGGSIEFNDYNGAIWGIGSGADCDVRYFEVY